MKDDIKKKLLDICKKHPSLDIITAVNYEVVAEDWGYWVGEIVKIEIDYFCINHESERWFVGYDNIIEEIREEHEDRSECELLSDKEFDEYVNNIFEERKKSGQIKKAIIMYISI